MPKPFEARPPLLPEPWQPLICLTTHLDTSYTQAHTACNFSVTGLLTGTLEHFLHVSAE